MFNLLKRSRESVTRFESEMSRFFARSNSFLVHLNDEGVVLLVDIEGKLAAQLREAHSEECSSIEFAHVDSVDKAQEFVCANANKLRLILCHVEMLSNGNGYRFLTWLRENYPRVPVFVRECTQQEEERVKQFYSSTGVFLKGRTQAADYLRALCSGASPLAVR